MFFILFSGISYNWAVDFFYIFEWRQIKTTYKALINNGQTLKKNPERNDVPIDSLIKESMDVPEYTLYFMTSQTDKL